MNPQNELDDGPEDGSIEAVARTLLARSQWLAVAESCTGGLIAKLLTDRPGSSAWFERGLVTYSNRAKQELLGVSAATLERHGAVSREAAEAMVTGLLARAPADWALAVTGIAGPSGGSAEKPVGLVWLAWSQRGGAVESRHCHFSGDRAQIRRQAAAAALEGLLERLQRG